MKDLSRQHAARRPAAADRCRLGRLILGPRREVRELSGQVLREGAPIGKLHGSMGGLPTDTS